MKLIILKNNLLEALFSVEKSVGENANLPILKNVFLSAEKGKIKITATNLELAVIHTLSGKILEEGKLCIPFSLFYNITKNLNLERIQLEQKGYHLNIKTDNYEAIVYGQNPDDFPIIPTIITDEPILIFKNKFFKEYVSKVIVSAQHSEIRPEISGLFIRYQNNDLKFVATDSFRLTEKTLPAESYKIKTTKKEDIKIIIPFKTTLELLRIINDDDSDIQLFIEPHQILFRTERQDIISRIIDSEFPNYETIFPKEIKFEAIVNRQEMINSLRLTSVFTSRTNDVTIKTGDNKKFLEIFASESQLGENRYLVPAKLKGDKFLIVFNWRYLLDGLKIHDSNEVFLEINGPDRPALIRAPEDKGLLYVLMPIKS